MSGQLSAPPDPSWTWGSGSLSASWKSQEEEGWKTWDTSVISKADSYFLLTSAIIPRPIAFVSSLSASGHRNLAPFSYFSMINHDPPMVSISVGAMKDTSRNITETKEFVINLVSTPIVQAMNATSVDGPRELDEWLISGLTPISSETVKPERVNESAFCLECTLHHALPLGENSHILFVGHVRRIHARTALVAETQSPFGKVPVVDPFKLMPVCRLGGNTYASLGELYDIPRPIWKLQASEITESIEKTGGKKVETVNSETNATA